MCQQGVGSGLGKQVFPELLIRGTSICDTAGRGECLSQLNQNCAISGLVKIDGARFVEHFFLKGGGKNRGLQIGPNISIFCSMLSPLGSVLPKHPHVDAQEARVRQGFPE